MVADLPSGWTGLLPGSFMRVPVAETHEKRRIYLENELTLFIDVLRDVTLLTIENPLVDTACGLIIKD